MPIKVEGVEDKNLKLIHYNLAYKPWHFDNILYQEYFWKYAEKTEFIKEIREIKNSYTEEERFRDMEQFKNLKALCMKEADCVGDDRMFRKCNQERKHREHRKYSIRNLKRNKVIESQSREETYEKIRDLEKNGIFDLDVEQDPPTIPLTPDKVDYLREKGLNKIKNMLANQVAKTQIKELVKDKN